MRRARSGRLLRARSAPASRSPGSSRPSRTSAKARCGSHPYPDSDTSSGSDVNDDSTMSPRALAGVLEMLCGEIDGDGAAERMPVDVSARRIGLFRQPATSSRTRILVDRRLARQLPVALAESAIVDREDGEPEAPQLRHPVQMARSDSSGRHAGTGRAGAPGSSAGHHHACMRSSGVPSPTGSQISCTDDGRAVVPASRLLDRPKQELTLLRFERGTASRWQLRWKRRRARSALRPLQRNNDELVSTIGKHRRQRRGKLLNALRLLHNRHCDAGPKHLVTSPYADDRTSRRARAEISR